MFILIRGVECVVEWIVFSSRSSCVYLVLIFDLISLVFLLTVRLISFRVCIFRISYIAFEVFYSRFLFLLFFFIIRIFLLILSPNLIRILLGWDGLGVTSYLLVIYYQSHKSYNAGMITAITNRLGDVGIILCLRIISYKGSWSFFVYWWAMDRNVFIILVILLFAAITKSAQIPFSAWLPAAIAAPTPVSALVHSSTLVTAGIYLLIRFNFILVAFSFIKYLCLVGVFTIFMAGISALFEIDIKKIIALSTLSQLGVIIMVIGINMPLLGFFHLISHAFFKAILFICAGNLIHNFKDYQDIRIISLSSANIPMTLRYFMVANFRLCGLPFIAGFYSKDLILEIIIIGSLNMFVFFIILLSTIITVFYSYRIIFLLSRSWRQFSGIMALKDNDYKVFFRIVILFFPSIVVGLFLSWFFFPRNLLIFFPTELKLLVLFLIIFRGIFSSLLFSLIRKKIFTPSSVVWFCRNMWFLPLMFRTSLSYVGLISSKNFIKNNEIGWDEFVLFKYIYKSFLYMGGFFEKIIFSMFSQSIFCVWIFSLLFFSL